MMTRRSTVDWVLRRAAAAEPRVTLRYGVKVTGLLAARRQQPHVVGVRTSQGDLPADLVVDATGRRSPVDDWLAQIGARATATRQAECGVAYFSRHYRVRPAADLPGLLATRIVVALDEFLAGKWGDDNGAAQLVAAPLAADRRFRALRDPEVCPGALAAAGPAGRPQAAGIAARLADAVRADLSRARGDIAPELPDELMLAGITGWVQLFGMIGFELSGQFNNVIEARAEFFGLQMEVMADLIGL
jgi:hypothetical protein